MTWLSVGLLAGVVGCASATQDVESVDLESNDLGLTRLEIQHSTVDSKSVVELRGFDASGEQLAYLSVSTGTVAFAYEAGDPTELTVGREISLGLLGAHSIFDTVQTVMPGVATSGLVVPSSMAPFVHLAAVQRESSRVGITFDIRGSGEVALDADDETDIDIDLDKVKKDKKVKYDSAACTDFPTYWNLSAVTGMPPGATCAVTLIRDETIPFSSYQCLAEAAPPVGQPPNRLVTSLFSATACSNDHEGTNTVCGTGAGSPGQCIFGPCGKAANQVISAYDPPGGNPNCSVGFKKNKPANYEFTLGGVQTCSDDGCSDNNGINPVLGCTMRFCCYDAALHTSCARATACTGHCP